jgi:osmoprotectant transport system permease protein
MRDLFPFLSEHAPELLQKTMEHLSLTMLALLFASCIAIPLGILIQHSPFLRQTILKAGSVSQTIPSLAMLAFLVPFLGLGMAPTLVVLTFYAVYPLLLSTYTGLSNVPRECIEAADGLGFSTYNKLRYVELPLALPVMISGLRVATAMTIGIATIAAFIGAGGLGDFIMQGLSLSNSSLILLGAIPTALLALTLDFGISQLEKQFQNRGVKRSPFAKLLFTCAGVFLLFILCFSVFNDLRGRDKDTIIVASKNFNEQNLLAEIISQQIENKTNLRVNRKFNLGTTSIVHHALINGEIDLYPEYTGVAYTNVLQKEMKDNLTDKDVYDSVRSNYKRKFNLVWLKPFGFSNSQSLAIKNKFAEKHHISSISDLASISETISLAAPPDFLKRPDGLPGLNRVYGFKFKDIVQVDPNLMYAAIDNNQVEVIGAFTTDGKLKKHDLITLKDNKKLFPPYFAATVIRAEILEAYPQLYDAMEPLFGAITNEKMIELNAQVEVMGKSPRDVARQFLAGLKP